MSDVTLFPAAFENASTFGFSVGGYTKDGQHIDDFRLERNWGKSGRAQYHEIKVPPIASHCEGLYGGLLLPHYGHFLLESLSRVWALKTLRSDLPIIWHILSGKPGLTSWQNEIFGLLGINVDRFVLARKPVHMQSIYVPSPGYKIQLWADPYHAKALCVVDTKPVKGKKVWLSRSKLDEEAGKITNEDELEHELQAMGWLVIYPEQLSITEQIDAIKDAELLAGFEGSAFHTLMLVNFHGRVKIFERTVRTNPNYVTIANAKGLTQEILKVSLTHVSGDKPNKMTSRIKDISEVLALL